MEPRPENQRKQAWENPQSITAGKGAPRKREVGKGLGKSGNRAKQMWLEHTEQRES